MAGYIMNLNSLDSLKHCFHNGIYSTKLSLPKEYANIENQTYPNYWSTPQEGTLADYSTMTPGDNIYFFIKRKIYGIGKLISIDSECCFNNFPNSTAPITPKYESLKNTFLFDFQEDATCYRWICLFEPTPYFFKKGIDMDDVLSSNPSKFKMLRSFWKLSFLKIDDEENKALKDVILKANESTLDKFNQDTHFKFSQTIHNQIIQKLTINNNYKLNLHNFLVSSSDNTKFKHEMALEAGTLFQLSKDISNTKSIFGKWDYLSHQVIASPFKPIDYMDKMDIFGYRYITNFPGTISKYLVIELKKDSAKIEDIEQLLKYVDWINQEYSFGDYSMIEAFLVAKTIPDSVIAARNTCAIRNYIVGRRPFTSSMWTNLKLIEYTFNPITNEIDYLLK